MSSVELKLKMLADSKSIEKSLKNTAKDLEHTSKKAKQANKDVGGLGKSFTQAANNVAIFNGQLDPISGRLSAIGTGLTRFGVGGVALAAGVTAMTIGVSKLVGSLETYEQRQNKFNALLKATSYSAKLTATDLENLAQTTARNTLGDVAGTSEAINALLTFRSVQGDVFKQTIKLATDAKVAFGGNLREGVVAFGKALNDPIANLGSLSRKGIQFTDTQKDMIAGFVESGNLAKAQTIILKELNDQFGGLAEKEAPALTSELDSLSQSADNMMESLGRTETMKTFRDIMVQIAKGARKTADAISDKHSIQTVELKNIDKLVAAEEKALRFKLAADEKVTDSMRILHAISDSGTEQEIRNQANVVRANVENANKLKEIYIKRSGDLRAFFDEQHAEQDKQEAEFKKGRLKSLNGELSDLANKNKKIQSQMDKHHLSLVSGFEGEKEKVDRVFAAKVNAYGDSHAKQLKTLNSFKKKQLEILNESGASHEDVNDFLVEINDKRVAISEKFSNTLIKAEKARQAKLIDIDEKDAERDKAKLLRAERALKVQANAARKRDDFLNKINTGGSGKLGKIQQDFGGDLRQLEEYEKDKTFLKGVSEAERFEIFNEYRKKLSLAYNADVDAFKASEEKKTIEKREQAANRAANEFNKRADEGVSSVDEGNNGLLNFFGVNLDEIAEKQAELLDAKRAFLAEMTILETDDAQTKADKLAKIASVTREYDLQQTDLKAKGRAKMEGDMWNAVNTLGASGSKKAFKISKALNIAQVTIKTIDAAMGAYSSLSSIPIVGVALGAAAAAAIGAAGAVNVNKIKNQRMPQFHDGITSVERTGSYLLAEGERVVSSKLNEDLTADLKRRRQNDSSNQGNVNINLTLPDSGSYNGVEQWYNDNSDRIVAHIQYAMTRP